MVQYQVGGYPFTKGAGAGTSFTNSEGTRCFMLTAVSSAISSVTVRKTCGEEGLLPSRFSVEFQVGNGDFELRTFRNG